MRTWNDYKEHARSVSPERARDIDEIEEITNIITLVIQQRKAMNLSQRELAALCGVPQSTIARLESGKTMPTFTTLYNIFQHLGLQITITQKPLAQ